MKSGTSMGTRDDDYKDDVEMKQLKPGSLVVDFLEMAKKRAGGGIDDALVKTMLYILRACKGISYELRRSAGTEKKGSQNVFGDEQLAIDLRADALLFKHLKDSGCVSVGSSEEKPQEIQLGGCGYCVAFDPLDGSSIIGTNFAVGTIFGVWPGSCLVGANQTGRKQKAAGMAVYGPRTTITLAIDSIKGSHEFMLMDDRTSASGQWVYTRSFYEIKEGKLFAPGNLRATNDNEGYKALVDYWVSNGYTLRYTGGMVPDVNQLLIRGKGIFVNATSNKHKAKLRLLYEVAPIAYIVEKAGGKSSTGTMSALDQNITGCDIRTQVAYGSKKEVARFEKLVGKRFFGGQHAPKSAL
uniref:fructose-bisphosphatase n=1 Tax=Lotharella globosa TaxID=91324 RepID=A0A7S3YR17_9EUKA